MQIPTNPFAESRYTRLKEGTVRLRFFDFVDGWEYWTDAQGQIVPRGERAGEGGKPVRVKQDELTDLPLEARQAAKYFRAYKVYNYESERIEVLSLKQRTIIEPLIAYHYDEDWGNSEGLDTFDIAITRTGEGLDTTYQVTPKPKSEFKGKNEGINLKALYDGGDPFEVTATVAEEDDVDLDEVDAQLPGTEDLDGDL